MHVRRCAAQFAWRCWWFPSPGGRNITAVNLEYTAQTHPVTSAGSAGLNEHLEYQ